MLDQFLKNLNAQYERIFCKDLKYLAIIDICFFIYLGFFSCFFFSHYFKIQCLTVWKEKFPECLGITRPQCVF